MPFAPQSTNVNLADRTFISCCALPSFLSLAINPKLTSKQTTQNNFIVLYNARITCSLLDSTAAEGCSTVLVHTLKNLMENPFSFTFKCII